MADRSVRVVLRANVADFKAQLNSASKSLDDLVKKSDKSAQLAQTRLGRLAQSAEYQREAWASAGTALLGAGTLMALGVAGAVKQFADFDQQMSAVQAATHETAANMGLLREAATQAGADTAYSATEAASAIEELAKAGVSTADILNGGLGGALSLAAAGGLEVGKAAEIASMALNQFKLRGSDVEHVADLLAAGASKAMGSVDDLGMALKQSGLVASQTGLSIEETTGALSAFASNGLLGSDAGTSFKTMLQRLNPQSKQAANMMDDLGLKFYNARGEFVGIVDVARQLETAFRGLSAQEIADAMQTLFGSDAVRAASVLYSQGAEGIQEWINKVNDSGYAAETAKLRMDNLYGDFEKLMGSAETVFLRSGSGMNATLRSIVQMADRLVDALGTLSPEMLSAIGLITSFGAANLLARGAILRFTPALLDMHRAFRGLDTSVPFVGRMGKGLSQLGQGARETMGAVRALGSTWVIARANGVGNVQAMSRAITPVLGGMGRAATGFGSALLGAVGGPVGLAITAGLAAITYALDSYVQSQAAANAKIGEYKTLLDETGKLTSESALAKVAENLQEAGALDALEKINIKASVGVKAAVDEKEFVKLRDQLQAREKSLSLKVNPSGESAARIRGEAEAYKAQVEELENVRTALSALDSEHGAIGEAAKNHSQLERAMEGVSDAADDQAKSISDAAGAAEAQTEALKNLLEAQSELAGVVLSSRQAQRNFEESLDDATAALEKNGQTLDVTTEAGRNNQAALDDIADSAWDLIKARQAEGAEESELQGIMETSREAFVRTAQQMGLNKEAAIELADRLNLIPGNVKTEIKQRGADEVKSKAREVKDAVNNIPRHVGISVDTSDVYAAIGSLQQLQAEIRASGGSTRVAYGQGGRGGQVVGFSTGGAVYGAGTETSDSIPALLSHNEHVLTASDVRKLGGHENVYRLRAAIQAGNVPRFAQGGAVGRVPTSMRAASNVNVSMPERVTLTAEDGTFLGVFRMAARSEAIDVVRKAGR